MVALALDVGASDDIPPDRVEAARRHVKALGRYTDTPLAVRLTLRHGGRGESAFHAAGPAADVAAETVAERLRRQLRRVVDADVAQRNDPAVIRKALEDLAPEPLHRPRARVKPPEEREIVHRRTYADHPESTLEAISDLIDLDEEFHLFVHVHTREDVVVHHRDDGRIGLLHPRGSILADEADEIVAPEPSRYSEPIPLDVARSEMDVVEHRFVYFIDAADGRGKVIYLRHDGDYGLVEPR
jgi:sigma 54 modulation/S30EA-like ribosomal protein